MIAHARIRTAPDDPAFVRRRLAAVVSAVDADTDSDPPPGDGRAFAHQTDRADPVDRAGRLVERWIPGGTTGISGLRTQIRRHPVGTVTILIGVLTAIITAIALSSSQPTAEAAPALPAAITVASTHAQPTNPTPATLVVSVVGRVRAPGLVTLPGGSRVADAIHAAGGLVPGTDDTVLNLARRLADGEQIYVGIPVPPGVQDQPAAQTPAAQTPAAQDPAAPMPSVPDVPTGHGRGRKGTAPLTGKIHLNTATAEELLALPGVGPATAQRIINWRNQHGHFDSVGQLRDVGGIGPAKFAKLAPVVTT